MAGKQGPEHWIRIMASLGLAILLFFIGVAWSKVQIITHQEFSLVSNLFNLRTYFKRPAPEDSLNRYVFIDVTWAKTLIPKHEGGFQVGNQPITDRAKLAQLFEALAKNKSHRYVVCDLFFADPSPDDSALTVAINKAGKTVCSYHRKRGVPHWEPEYPALKVPLGLADYESLNYIFLRMQYVYNDTSLQVPLRMYKDIHQVDVKPNGFISSVGGYPLYDPTILNIRMSADSVFNTTGIGTAGTWFYLDEIVALGPDFIQELCKDKIVVIGQFSEGDMHTTLMGSMPGTLLLINGYLALVHKDNLITPAYGLFLLIGFWIICLRVFYQDDFNDFVAQQVSRSKGYKSWQVFVQRRAPFLNKTTTKTILELVGYLVLFGLMMVLSYILFNRLINLVIHALVLEALHRGYNMLMARMNKKATDSVQPDEELIVAS